MNVRVIQENWDEVICYFIGKAVVLEFVVMILFAATDSIVIFLV